MNGKTTGLAKGLLVILMSLAILNAHQQTRAEPESSSKAKPAQEQPMSDKKTIEFLAKSSKEDADAENSECKLHIESDLAKAAGDEGVYAYAGNGYSYNIGCSVDDHRSKIGDKYYVIDMIVYGPNTRVAKAWREQFSAATVASRYLSLDRSLSFRWLGSNSIVCSITKYNNQLNKFTKICQKTIYVNVTEKASPAGAAGSYQPPFSSFRLQKGPSKNSLLRLIYSSSTAGYGGNTNKINRSFAGPRQDNQLKQRQISTEDQILKTEFTTPAPKMTTTMDAKMREKDKIEWFNKFKESKFMAKSLDSLNARAMQFKGSAENSKIITQSAAASNGSSSVSKLLKSTERYSYSNSNSKPQMLQPLPVIFIFIVVFSVSIATIIYLTYHQNKEDAAAVAKIPSHDPDESVDHTTTKASCSDKQSCASSAVEPASGSRDDGTSSQNSSSCLSAPDECTKLKLDDFDDDDQQQIGYERKLKYLSKQI